MLLHPPHPPSFFWFQPNTYVGTCMSIEHIYMRPSRLKRYIQSNPVDTTSTGNTPWVKGCEAVLGRRSSWSILDASAPLQVVAELWSFIEGELQVEPKNAPPWLWWWWLRHCRCRWMESIRLLCNEKSTSAALNPYDAADDHEGSPCIWWESQLLCISRCHWWLVWHHAELEPEKRGPALRNRLGGEAQQYKRLLDREMLRDPHDGVNYFKRFLRPHFIKGAQNVFLYRFMQFMKYNRGTMDLLKWMTRFQLTGNRLFESWMDVIPDLLITSPEAILYVQTQRQDRERDQNERAQVAAATPGADPHVIILWTDEIAFVAFRQLNENRRQQQRQAFPLGENLLALIFVSLADLTEDQRNTLTRIMTHRGRTLDQYNMQELRDLFLEMFCTTKTAVDNPMMQRSVPRLGRLRPTFFLA